MAFADYDGKSFIRVVELDTNKRLQRLDTERTHHLALSGNGKLLLAADFKRIEVWDFLNGKRIRELEDVPETNLPVLKLSSGGPWLILSNSSPSASGRVGARRCDRSRSACRTNSSRSGELSRLLFWIHQASGPIAVGVLTIAVVSAVVGYLGSALVWRLWLLNRRRQRRRSRV